MVRWISKDFSVASERNLFQSTEKKLSQECILLLGHGSILPKPRAGPRLGIRKCGIENWEVVSSTTFLLSWGSYSLGLPHLLYQLRCIRISCRTCWNADRWAPRQGFQISRSEEGPESSQLDQLSGDAAGLDTNLENHCSVPASAQGRKMATRDAAFAGHSTSH